MALVTVARYCDAMDAEVARSFLGGHGLLAYTPDFHQTIMNSPLSIGYGPRVMVHRDDVDLALTLIRSVEDQPVDAPPGGKGRIAAVAIVTVLLGFLIGAPIARRCRFGGRW